MPQQQNRAGQTIRQLALRRRVKSIASFTIAGLFTLSPFFLIKNVGPLLGRLTSNNSLAQLFSYALPIVYGGFLIASLFLIVCGIRFWEMANRADQGARGEEITSRELSILKGEGWIFEYGMRLGNGLGDADILCVSPREKAYVVDVKSHRGEVMTDGQMLSRRMGRTSYPFEKDFIAQTMKQALQVRKQEGFSFVTPILSFSEAKVEIPGNRIRNVYVVERADLVSLLRSLG